MLQSLGNRSGSGLGRLSLLGLALALGIALYVGGSSFWTSAREVARPSEQPNVVVIVTDDQDLRSLEVMRKTRRQLGREGVEFTNSFATYPLCCRSRATYLTGQYAHNNGVMSNRADTGGYENFREQGSLPISMQRAGYRTGYIGKYLNGYAARGNDRQAVPRGWDEWQVATDATATQMYDYKLNENGRIREYGSRDRDYQTDVYADKSVRFIRESADRPEPFFLTVMFAAPHGEVGRGMRPNPRPAPRHWKRFEGRPLPRGPSFDEEDRSDKPSFVREDKLKLNAKRFLKSRYRDRLASLLAVDDAVARIVRELRQAGELEDTLIVFTSDNGYLLGEHGLKQKKHLYEESVKVPLLVRGPGVPRGEEREQLVGNIDLAPTIMELAGAEPGVEVDGRSLMPPPATRASEPAVSCCCTTSTRARCEPIAGCTPSTRRGRRSSTT